MSGNINISKKRKFVADGVFYAELNEFLARELGPDGYSGVEVRVTPLKTEIIIRATRTQHILGEKNRRIRELTSLVQRRFNLADGKVELYAQRVQNRAMCAVTQAESLRFKLSSGLAVRRACYGVLRYIMENGAKGCEIIVSGKLRAQRAKAMKFKDGYMIKSGDAARDYVDSAVRHLKLKQGVLGIKVRIMMPYDPRGEKGVTTKQPDVWEVKEPKEEETRETIEPYAQSMLPAKQPVQQQAPVQQQPVPVQQQLPIQPVVDQQVGLQQYDAAPQQQQPAF